MWARAQPGLVIALTYSLILKLVLLLRSKFKLVFLLILVFTLILIGKNCISINTIISIDANISVSTCISISMRNFIYSTIKIYLCLYKYQYYGCISAICAGLLVGWGGT